MRDLVVLEYTSNTTKTAFKVVPEQAKHPILEGITADFPVNVCVLVGPLKKFESNPPVSLMVDNTGSSMVAVRTVGAGRAVNFAFTGGNCSGGLNQLPVQKLILNAINW
jgi:hypothetical protein